MWVLLNGCPCWYGDYGCGMRLLALARAVRYCALLRPLHFIAEQICIRLEHAGGFVSGDLHAILHQNCRISMTRVPRYARRPLCFHLRSLARMF